MFVGLVGSPLAETLNWPNQEMSSRGDLQGIIVGILIAIPSGAGVALSILGNNTASLVGVAISASLLPPIVNSGLNIGYFFVRLATPNANTPDPSAFAIIAGNSFIIALLNISIIYIVAIFFFKVIIHL